MEKGTWAIALCWKHWWKNKTLRGIDWSVMCSKRMGRISMEGERKCTMGEGQKLAHGTGKAGSLWLCPAFPSLLLQQVKGIEACSIPCDYILHVFEVYVSGEKQRDGRDVLHQVVRTLILLSDSFGLSQGRCSSTSVTWWVFSCSPCRVLSPCRVVSTIPLCMIQCLGALLSKEWVHICPLLKRLLWDAEDAEQWGQ